MKPNGVKFSAAPPVGPLTTRGAVGGSAASFRSVADIYCIGAARRYTTLIFGLRVPDDGTVTFYRDIKFKMGSGVVHCC